MATINVTTTVDENNNTGSLSLREAFIKANSSAGDDTIVLKAGNTYKLSRQGTNEEKSATGDLDILGSGGKLTIISSGNSQATIDGGGIDRVLDVLEKSTLDLENIVITGGYVNEAEGAGIRIRKSGPVTITNSTITGNFAGVGGIYNYNSLLTVTNSTISGNTTTVGGAGIDNYKATATVKNSTITHNMTDGIGGGIENFIGILTVIDSTISSNTATFGGGIYNYGTATVTNSNISGNIVSTGGGGIMNDVAGVVTLTNSTISSNTASSVVGGINNLGGTISLKNSTVTANQANYLNGIYSNGYNHNGQSFPAKVNFSNSIIAGNGKKEDLINEDIFNGENSTTTSNGYNLIGVATGLETVFNKTGDKKGNATSPLIAKLGPLQDNGGLTFTHAILTGSPAIDAGNSAITKDQRGYSRNGTPDIGAYEYNGILKGDGNANVLIGSPQADIIDGLAGHDTITGQTGNDSLTGGDGNDYLNGNEGNDTLIGSGGNDIFLVNPGNDRLTGGLGADKFTYNTKATFAKTAVGLDTITDFIRSQGDKIVLDKTTFNKISSNPGNGFSTSSKFVAKTSNLDTSVADIVYNSATGELFYNQNGSAVGYGTGGKFLVFSNKPILGTSDFIIQA